MRKHAFSAKPHSTTVQKKHAHVQSWKACIRGMRAHSCLYVYIHCNKRNHRSPCLIFTSRLHACSCMSVFIMQCVARKQNWLSLFPDPSFVQCSPRSAALGPSGVVAGDGGTIEKRAQQVQESEVTRLVSKVRTSNSLCCLVLVQIGASKPRSWRKRHARLHLARKATCTAACARRRLHLGRAICGKYVPMHMHAFIYTCMCS